MKEDDHIQGTYITIFYPSFDYIGKDLCDHGRYHLFYVGLWPFVVFVDHIPICQNFSLKALKSIFYAKLKGRLLSDALSTLDFLFHSQV